MRAFGDHRDRITQRREGLVEGCGVDPLELRLLGLPCVSPVGQRPLSVQLKHEYAEALPEGGDGDRSGGREAYEPYEPYNSTRAPLTRINPRLRVCTPRP